MIYGYGLIIAAYFFLWIISRKENSPTIQKMERPLRPFAKMAIWLVKRIGWVKKRIKSRRWLQTQEFAKKQLAVKLHTLDPGRRKEDEVEQFYTEKYSLMLLIFAVGTIMSTLLYISDHNQSVLTEDGQIIRNGYGQGNKMVQLTAYSEDEQADIDYELGEQKYTIEEIGILYEELIQKIPDIICGDNSGIEEIVYPLHLVTSVPEYPFNITWETDCYEIVSVDGEIKNKELEEPAVVVLTGIFRYEDLVYEHQVPVRICPYRYTKTEWLQKQIHDAITGLDESSATEEFLVLPKEVDSSPVVFRERPTDSSRYLFVLAALSVAIIHIVKKQEVDQKLEERKNQLLMDYSEVVNKLSLYIGAGMTIRNAFFKIGEDYKKQKNEKFRYAYEEILMTCYEIQSGKSETEAYDHFGKRCQVHKYIKLATLLTQNLRKGSNDLLNLLKRETEDAFQDRKNLAKKMGEEAGTKLLLPMMMMLCIVMVIIIVPAYFSFSF